MTASWVCSWLGLALIVLQAPEGPQNKPPDADQTYQVPYRNTDTNHALVRVRINGKGPFNLLVDTGAPLLYLSTETAAKVGIQTPKDQFYCDVSRLDFEGGPFLTNLKARVEDPFQLVGMNALGLPGASIDGILGFSVLSRFRFTLDPTKDRMTWMRLTFDPPDLEVPADPKERAAPDDVKAMNMLGPMMKFAAMVLGKKPETQIQPRGWLGVELDPKDDDVPPRILTVVNDSPSSEAGLKPGDRLVSLNGRSISDWKSAREAIAKIKPGDEVKIGTCRDGDVRELTLIAKEGL